MVPARVGVKHQNPTNRARGRKASRGRNPLQPAFYVEKTHCEKLPSMAGSVGGDEEVGKWEAWTPQPMMCGTQVKMGGSSAGDNTGPEIEEKITELADQLRVQCLRETAVIPQRFNAGSCRL